MSIFWILYTLQLVTSQPLGFGLHNIILVAALYLGREKQSIYGMIVCTETRPRPLPRKTAGTKDHGWFLWIIKALATSGYVLSSGWVTT